MAEVCDWDLVKINPLRNPAPYMKLGFLVSTDEKLEPKLVIASDAY
jgi:hypothetical protein